MLPGRHSLEALVKVEGQRWTIEGSFETAKNAFGLDHNESRSWHGWHRQVSLVMLAFAAMATIRHHANRLTPHKTLRRLANQPSLVRWPIQESRRVAMRLAQRHIQPAQVIAWSVRRRAHQAVAQRSHLKQKCNCSDSQTRKAPGHLPLHGMRLLFGQHLICVDRLLPWHHQHRDICATMAQQLGSQTLGAAGVQRRLPPAAAGQLV